MEATKKGEDCDCLMELIRAGKILGINVSCDYFPCHKNLEDCTWCYCPFYPCEDELTGGRYVKANQPGLAVWSCKDCTWIHRLDVSLAVMKELQALTSERQLDSHEALKRIRLRILESLKPEVIHVT
ncbi:MAG: cysteine-rich small domain-containing protein [Candidatus Bathyarchaeia archaeon]